MTMKTAARIMGIQEVADLRLIESHAAFAMLQSQQPVTEAGRVWKMVRTAELKRHIAANERQARQVRDVMSGDAQGDFLSRLACLDDYRQPTEGTEE